MITQHYLEQDGNRLLFRLAIADAAVLDILTDVKSMRRCIQLLSGPSPKSLQWERLGTFGGFQVTMTRFNRDVPVSVFVDGPDLGTAFRGGQSMGIYVQCEEMLAVMNAVCPAAEQGVAGDVRPGIAPE